MSRECWENKSQVWEFPGGSVVKAPHFHWQARVQFPVRELKSRKPHSRARKIVLGVSWGGRDRGS